MKIILCGSITAAAEILQTCAILQSQGHEVEVPEGVKREELRERTDVDSSEKAADKIKYDLIRGYFHKIQAAEMVVIVNPPKRNIPGYIGANTFLEMAFAHVLGKPLYCLYALPRLTYLDEMLAMQPHILSGNLDGFAL